MFRKQKKNCFTTSHTILVHIYIYIYIYILYIYQLLVTQSSPNTPLNKLAHTKCFTTLVSSFFNSKNEKRRKNAIVSLFHTLFLSIYLHYELYYHCITYCLAKQLIHDILYFKF